MGAVDRAALLTQGKDKNIIKMKIENKEMIIHSFASEIGKTEEKLKLIQVRHQISIFLSVLNI